MWPGLHISPIPAVHQRMSLDQTYRVPAHTPYPTLPYPTLPYPTLPYPTLPYPTLPYPTTPHHTTPHHTTPHLTTPHHISPHHTTPRHTTPHHTIPYHTIPFHTTPHQTITAYFEPCTQSLPKYMAPPARMRKKIPEVKAPWLPSKWPGAGGGWGLWRRYSGRRQYFWPTRKTGILHKASSGSRIRSPPTLLWGSYGRPLLCGKLCLPGLPM